MRIPPSNQCCTCGKFFPYEQMQKGGGASWVFVPDSYMTSEEERWQCKSCTDTRGPILPSQNVVISMCSGVM